MSERKLDLILDRSPEGVFSMFACRGEGKGCKRNSHRESKVRCDDCVGPLAPEMTLEEVEQRLARGEA